MKVVWIVVATLLLFMAVVIRFGAWLYRSLR